MEKHQKRKFFTALVSLALFALWTAAIRLIDVQPIGPQDSSVGFAAFNSAFHHLTGVHMTLYALTDWLGLIPIGFVFGFASLGLLQWIKRKRLTMVDRSLLVLGGFYILVMAAYLFFEANVVNYRPVLIEGYLEASYPSSTTILVLTVIPTAAMQLNSRAKKSVCRKSITSAMILFLIFMVVGRTLSGVHWITDIIGGILLSTGLVMMYDAFAS